MPALIFNEQYLIWLMVCYGNILVPFYDGGDVSVSQYILNAMAEDDILFTDPVLNRIADEIKTSPTSLRHFIFHPDIEISSLVSGMINNSMLIKEMDSESLVRDVFHAILSLKSIYLSDMKAKVRAGIKRAQDAGDMDSCIELLKKDAEYQKIAMMIGKELGRVVN
jgi:hypothetical protein